jgi:hypothetical protein
LNQLFDLGMCQAGLLQPVQFATQDVRSQPKRTGQFLLLPPRLPPGLGNLLTKLR